MKDVNKLAETLHPLERKILPHLKDQITSSQLQLNLKLSIVEVNRALEWLAAKNIITLKQEKKEIINLDSNGSKYLQHGLPEKQFLKALTKPLTLQEIKSQANLNDDELKVSIGLLKKKAAIDFGKQIKITDQGRKLLQQETLEEKFLKKLPCFTQDLSPEEKFAFQALKKRKDIIKLDEEKTTSLTLTKLGKSLQKVKLRTDLLDSLTPFLLKTKSWKNKNFRRYDISIPTPQLYGGKRHFVNQAVDYARRVWIDLGFKEMRGSIINTSFWNFDALFTAQDHPVRDLQDTFYLKNPKHGKLPSSKLVQAVSSAHESGGKTKSTGWKYSWSKEEARKNILRTHTTVLSAQTLASLKESDLPAKFFAVGKNFRNETVDWSHLFEFNQFEGIVVDENANLRHLLGYLKNFAKKIGFEKIRFRPAHFPYTEPSVEGEVYDPVHKKWIEVFAAGIFRPEVVVPLLGKDVPVLAWGPGLDRQITNYYKIKDLRELYKNDLKQLREMKIWLK